jgi:hypothetical protein
LAGIIIAILLYFGRYNMSMKINYHWHDYNMNNLLC